MRRKGVLALSAHLGNFAMIGARLAAAGYPFSVVVKHPSDEQFAQLITKYRAQVGIDTISAKPRREAARGILQALRDNRIVLVVADEFKSGDITVEFMGQNLPAPRGPATLALRTGAVTLPMFATRQPDGSIVLAIGPAIKAVHGDSLEETITATTALYTRHLEEVILRYPDQWSWLGFPRKRRVVRLQDVEFTSIDKRRKCQSWSVVIAWRSMSRRSYFGVEARTQYRSCSRFAPGSA